MQENYSTYSVPSFARADAYAFDRGNQMAEVFRELDKISEEIEKCRDENS